MIRINNICHQKGIRFISADSRGVIGAIFCDFGDQFSVFDQDGEEPTSVIISSITKVLF